MKKTLSFLIMVILFTACKKEVTESGEMVQAQVEDQQMKPPPPPPNANPVLTFRAGFQINPNRIVPAIYVMDITGTNMTKMYSNYTSQTHQTPDFPAWSADGSKLCFTLNNADLYTLNIALVNGVPTGSGATKIADGVAAGGSYKQGKWRPGQNQIACVWKKTVDPDKIQLLPSTGGSAIVLYTAQSTDWFIEEDIAFNSNGSSLVFSERQISTGFVFLKVFDVNSSQVIKSIDLSQYHSVREMDWAKSPGSNIVAITTVEPLCAVPMDNNGIHRLQTVDVSSAAPSLTWMRNSVGNISWSPNDTQITISGSFGRVCNIPTPGCCFSSFSQLRVYTIASGTASGVFSTLTSLNPDWKR